MTDTETNGISDEGPKAEGTQDERSTVEDAEDEQAQRDSPAVAEEECVIPSHFRNTEIPAYIRYGIPMFLVAAFGLYMTADIGGSITAIRVLVPNDPILQPQEDKLFTASVYTSVQKLWETGSYALTILVVICSICWPYIKLSLSMFAWIRPYNDKPRRREQLLVVIDALGKWSFVDIIVFLIITVTFRSTVELAGGVLIEVYVVPLWGIAGFTVATCCSLIATQIILYQHRKVTYKPIDPLEDDERRGLQSIGDLSLRDMLLPSIMVVVGFSLYLSGCLVYIFRMGSQQGGDEPEYTYYSIVSIGQALPDSSREEDMPNLRWLQFLWFMLGVALPSLSSSLFLLLLWLPLTKQRLERLFFMAEVGFAWSCAETYVISLVTAVAQIPKVGNGFIESGCFTCYVVSADLLPELAVIVIGAAMNIVASVWVFRLAHRCLYEGRLRHVSNEPKVSEPS